MYCVLGDNQVLDDPEFFSIFLHLVAVDQQEVWLFVELVQANESQDGHFTYSSCHRPPDYSSCPGIASCVLLEQSLHHCLELQPESVAAMGTGSPPM